MVEGGVEPADQLGDRAGERGRGVHAGAEVPGRPRAGSGEEPVGAVQAPLHRLPPSHPLTVSGGEVPLPTMAPRTQRGRLPSALFDVMIAGIVAVSGLLTVR